MQRVLILYETEGGDSAGDDATAARMDFNLTESQQEIARLAGQLLDDGKADPWKELARAGLLGLSVPRSMHRFSALISDLMRFLGGAEYRLERQSCSST